MFTGFHWYDIAILAVLALLVFGPKRLPEMGSAVGKTIKEFQKSMKEITDPTASRATATELPTATEAKQLATPAASATPAQTSVAEQQPVI